jgi:hypothetical protein
MVGCTDYHWLITALRSRYVAEVASSVNRCYLYFRHPGESRDPLNSLQASRAARLRLSRGAPAFAGMTDWGERITDSCFFDSEYFPVLVLRKRRIWWPCRRKAAERMPSFRIETPAGLSRGRDFFDPDISQISRFGPQGQAKFCGDGDALATRRAPTMDGPSRSLANWYRPRRRFRMILPVSNQDRLERFSGPELRRANFFQARGVPI